MEVTQRVLWVDAESLDAGHLEGGCVTQLKPRVLLLQGASGQTSRALSGDLD